VKAEPRETPLQNVGRHHALRSDLNKKVIAVGGDRVEGVSQEGDQNQVAAIIDALVDTQQFVVHAVYEQGVLGEMFHNSSIGVNIIITTRSPPSASFALILLPIGVFSQ